MCVCVAVSTHLIRIMFQRAIVAHVSHSVQICVSLVDVVHIGAVVLLVQYPWGMNGNVSYEKPVHEYTIYYSNSMTGLQRRHKDIGRFY